MAPTTNSALEGDSTVAGTLTDKPRYEEVALTYGAALSRLARAYEADAEICRDLLQDIHVALWSSLKSFDGRCSLRTWVYRVAHNVAASHVLRRRRTRKHLMVSLDDLDLLAEHEDAGIVVGRHQALDRLMELIRQLNPLDRQIMLCYLEDMDAASIAEVTGMSRGNVSTKVHRIKSILIRRFREGVKA